MDALFKECARPGVPGASVIIVRDGRVLFKKSYGLADVEKQVRATPATNYRLASLTKQFTAMAIMILGDRGKLSFDQRLSEFFPELPAYAKSVTIRQILNHQSGLPDYEGLVPAAAPEVVESPAEQLKDKDVLGFLQKQQRLLFEPGSQYRYSNTGYVVLGLLVERVSGLSYSQFLKKDIFDPLGMAGTVAHVEGVTTVRNRAYGYSRGRGRPPGRRPGTRFVRTDQSPTSATLGDGGVYSSIDDLAKWDQALYEPKLVKRETFQQAIRPAPLANGKPGSYGFGWEIRKLGESLQMAHSGTTLGFRNYITRVPQHRFSVIILMNRTDLNPSSIGAQIVELYLGALGSGARYHSVIP